MNRHLHVPMIWSVGLRGQVLKQCHSYMLVCVYCDLCCMSKQLQQELWLAGVASHQGLCLAYHILCHPFTGGGMSYRVTHLVRCRLSCQYIKSCTLCKKCLQNKSAPRLPQEKIQHPQIRDSINTREISTLPVISVEPGIVIVIVDMTAVPSGVGSSTL